MKTKEEHTKCRTKSNRQFYQIRSLFLLALFASIMISILLPAAMRRAQAASETLAMVAISPTTNITPVGTTNVEFTPAETEVEEGDVIGTVHVTPTDGPETVTMKVPGVEPGDKVKVYYDPGNGNYIELDGYVDDDGNVVVNIPGEGDIFVKLDDEPEVQTEILVPDTEPETPPQSETPPETPPHNPPVPPSPQTADSLGTTSLPLTLAVFAGIIAVFCFMLSRRSDKHRR